jgi:2-keto-4-pentenoate hydratase/2-oxohepta-3-ene-1,7-dioic acid hydratase in catechol pathway
MQHVLRFEHSGSVQWGLLRNGGITPIPGDFPTTASFVQHADPDRLARLGEPTLALGDVRVLAPVTRNQRFICQGANYVQHMLDSGVSPDDKRYNMIFTKAPSCIVPADHDVIRPANVKLLDYEIELGLVIKRDITGPLNVQDDHLHELIAGIVVVNDYSARDIQIPETQFYKGKSFRTFGPVGPFLCLLDKGDIPRLRDLELTLTVNGEARQRDNTRNMVYGPAATLTELSHVHDLSAGDLIATGTPSGCALTVPSPAKQRLAALLPERTKWQIFHRIQLRSSKYLKHGDVVEATIRSADGAIDLGVQRNTVRDAATTAA